MRSPRRILKRCPLCKAEAVEGSSGWSTDFACGTRRGNLSLQILWKGLKCSKTKGLDLPDRAEFYRAEVERLFGCEHS